MKIPFTKAHGAGNDFLLTRAGDAGHGDLAATARAICSRHTGIGADGWLLMRPGGPDCDAAITLYNADGSVPELSGNGTRCAAALLAMEGAAAGPDVRIATGAGVKRLRLLGRSGFKFTFEMNMGLPALAAERTVTRIELERGAVDVTLLDVGNPQCAVFADRFPPDWRETGAELERHARFPNRTNVSFVRVVNEHFIDVLFYERGVGPTQSSGTGATGAAAAAILRGLARSPVTVATPAGELRFRWDGDAFLAGPAEIVGAGEFHSG